MTPSAPTPLRQLIENRLSQLTAETESLFAEARERARREIADQLNQAVRRLRQAASLEELTATLADAAGLFASTAIVLRVEDGAARTSLLDIPLDSAAALRGAIDTRDPVVAAATAGELSAALLDALGQPEEPRVSVFPVVVSERVPLLLCARGGVQSSSLELLAQAAAASWAALEKPAKPDNLVLIAPVAAPEPAPPVPAPEPAPPVPASTPASAWAQLPIDEQRTHLRAQRFARVQVAEMRLNSSDAVHAAREHRDLYESLREPIDRARDAFRTRFFADCPSMVDYLHLELLRTLANDDPDLLGNSYPGPMV